MYAPLWCKSNFSFLEGASHPAELVERAHHLGVEHLALTDRDGVHGIVRAHVRARELGVHLVVGSQVTVADGWQWVDKTRQVPVYTTETYYETVPVYEKQLVDVTTQVPVYEDKVETSTSTQYQPAVPLGDQLVWVNDQAGIIYVDGRVLSVEGDLQGRLTLVSTDKVRITGDIRYVDADGDTAMQRDAPNRQCSRFCPCGVSA